jgi:hypothetical protein
LSKASRVLPIATFITSWKRSRCGEQVAVARLRRCIVDKMKRGAFLLAAPRHQLSPDIRVWSNVDVVSFLQAHGVRSDLVSAIEVQNVTGQQLYDKGALICSYTEQDKVRAENVCREFLTRART